MANQFKKTDYGYCVVIDSPKYGYQNVKISEDDYKGVSELRWCVSYEKNKKTNIGSGKLYASSSDTKNKWLMHRYILDAPKGMVVDHINGDGLDNRRENLRLCTQSQNRMNANRIPHHNASGVIGVCWNNHTQKWLAYIYKNYKRIYLGDFPEFDDAVSARQNAEQELFAGYVS